MLGDPREAVFPILVVVGVIISIFSRRSSVVVTLGVPILS